METKDQVTTSEPEINDPLQSHQEASEPRAQETPELDITVLRLNAAVELNTKLMQKVDDRNSDGDLPEVIAKSGLVRNELLTLLVMALNEQVAIAAEALEIQTALYQLQTSPGQQAALQLAVMAHLPEVTELWNCEHPLQRIDLRRAPDGPAPTPAPVGSGLNRGPVGPAHGKR